MIVCITEKPSVAKDIASILGADHRHDGFFEGNGYRITWTFGHLCTLKEPHDYSEQWKKWSLGALPIIPERFGIKLIDDPGIIKQFGVIAKLIEEADEVINCGDAGQEGELIQRWVMQKANCKKPVKRLWISSLTDESIREGFKSLRPQDDFNSLYYAGLSRAIGDWILGMNATRLYTLKYAQNRGVLSIGRVQTPTLALIVNRQQEIENFVPEDYWEIKTLYRGVTFNATKGKYTDEAEAIAAMERIKPFNLTITGCSTKKGKEAPPRLFDLTSLQVECNKKLSFSADETLKIIQSLYEKKVTTYPRVDTTYLSEDIYPKIPGILQAMSPYAQLTAPILSSGKIAKSKKVFDNSKVTDHHAIIPTNVDPVRVALNADEKRVYDMIAKRFIASFYPDCDFLQTTVEADANGEGFKATGKQIVKNGWRDIFKRDSDSSATQDESESQIMPEFIEGESESHEPSLLKKATQPPKMYTEGTLLRAMETAGKFVDDEELREAMKENGIGRPSTRAAIIELLLKRHYIRKERKALIATPAGVALIATIEEELLKSAKLTGLWENKLRRIERNEYDAATFIAELKALINDIVINVLSDNSSRGINIETDKAETKTKKPRSSSPKPRKVSSYDKIKCPKCKKGHIIKGKTAFGCSEYKNGCDFRLLFANYSESLTPTELKEIIKAL